MSDLLPTLQHAETHPAYSPKPPHPYAAETERITRSINELKITDPQKGEGVYEGLVDQLVANSLAITKEPEYTREPSNWSAPQRCVWRSSKLPYERRYDVINDRRISQAVKVFAYVSAGRWVASCPFPRCNGCQYASFLDRRFHCVEEDCENKPVDGQWIEVIWPDNLTAIEAWLSRRPTENKHWNPGETLEDIAKQDMIILKGVN